MAKIVMRIVNRLTLIPFDIGLILGFLLLIGGFGLVAWQVFLWLDEKIWYSYSLYTLVEYGLNSIPSEDIHRNPVRLGFYQWFYQPQRMLGLHTILIWVLGFIPISLLLIIGGGWLAVVMYNLREELRE
jgi:hypothetical protein